jgi:hypothetical protein
VHTLAVRAVGVSLLALTSLHPAARAQESDSTVAQPPQAVTVELEQNYPNPLTSDTRIPFVLGERLFRDGRPVTVTLRVFNVLRQLVAIPVALDHPTEPNRPILELVYPAPGRYLAYWDGRDQQGRPVPSGVYLIQIVANGESQIRKAVVAR